MKKLNVKAGIMKAIILSAVSAFTLVGCQKELDLKEPGNLVPKTVDEDPSLPSIRVNGTHLHAEAFGNPADPMVIYLHGGPGSDYRNALQVKQLTDNRYYVVFFDQRNSGLSKRHDKNTLNLDIMLDDLTAVIDHYRTSPLQKVFLFGHSWGGMLAAAYINKYPARIDGAVFAEPGGFTDEMVVEYGELSRKLKLLSEATSDAMYVDQFLTGRENDHEILDYKLGVISSYTFSRDNTEGIEGPYPFWRHGAIVLSRLLEIATDEGFDFTTNLHLFAPGVLFIYGELNTSYGPAFAQKEAAYFRQAQLVEIQDTGHEMIYFQWGQVYPHVLNYFNSLR